MEIVSGKELGRMLCEVFGIDPAKVAKITVVAEAGDVAKVVVEGAVMTSETDPLVQVLTSFAGIKKFKIEDSVAH